MKFDYPQFPRFSVERILNGLLLLIVLYALVSLAILAFSKDIAAVFTTFSPLLLLQYLLLVSFSLLLRALRWCAMGRPLAVVNTKNISWRQSAGIYAGGFTMVFAPARAGELWRAWALNRQQGLPYRRALPLILCDRLFDLSALLLFAAAGVFVALPAYRLPAIIAIALTLALFLLLLRPHWMRALVKWLWALCGKRRHRAFPAALEICRHIMFIVRPAAYLPLLLLSLLAWGFEGAALLFIASELNAVLGAVSALAVIGLGNVAGVLSLLPGGIGGYDVAMIYLLVQHGNTLALATSLSIIRIANVFYAALIGLPFFLYYSRRHSSA